MQVDQKKVVAPPPPIEYVISLTHQEAEDLFNVLGALGGAPPERETTSNLWQKLRDFDVFNMGMGGRGEPCGSTTLHTVMLRRKDGKGELR